MILYDSEEGRKIAVDNVAPNTVFIVGFDVPDTLQSFEIGVRCDESGIEYRSGIFKIGESDQIDLGRVRLEREAPITRAD